MLEMNDLLSISNQTVQWNEWKSFISQMYESKSVHKFGPTNFIEEWWMGIVHYYGDFHLVMVFYIFMNIFYAIFGVIFWLIDKLKLLDKYKVQQKYSTDLDYWQCLLNLFQNYILIILPLVYVAYPVFTILDFSTALPLPNLLVFLSQFLFCMVVEDIAHYWLHRMLHWPWLYKNIHKIHHTYTSPFGLAASYAHPLEVLILGFATFLGPLIIRPHFFTFYSWVLFRQLDAVATHCGYDIPHPFSFLPFYGGTTVHDYHHKTFIWNYSSRFIFMDKLFGTFKDTSKKTE